MTELSSTKTIAIQWGRPQSAEEHTAELSRQQDYRIIIPQTIEFGSRSQDDTIKIVPQEEVVGFKTAAASSFDVVAVGPQFTTIVEVKAPRAHLQKQQSATAF